MRTTKNRQVQNINDFWVWRDVGEIYWPSPYWLNIAAAGVWQNHANMTSPIITFSEPSKFKVYGEAQFVPTATVEDDWIAAGLKVVYKLNAAAVWSDFTENTSKWDGYHDNVTHNARRMSISHSWKKAFAFVGPEDTIQFRLEWFISAGVAALYHPEILIDICRKPG